MFSDMIRKSFKDEEFMSGRSVFLYIFRIYVEGWLFFFN